MTADPFALEKFGGIDSQKFRSSMTLFGEDPRLQARQDDLVIW